MAECRRSVTPFSGTKPSNWWWMARAHEQARWVSSRRMVGEERGVSEEEGLEVEEEEEVEEVSGRGSYWNRLEV